MYLKNIYINMSYPENHGKVWTQIETNQLMKEIKIFNIKKNSEIHKRTENAIFLKIIREAAKIYDSDNRLTLHDLSIITSLKISTLIQGFKKINYYKFINDNNEEITDFIYDNNGLFNKYYIIIPSILVISIILYFQY
jgi:hypothetical protein